MERFITSIRHILSNNWNNWKIQVHTLHLDNNNILLYVIFRSKRFMCIIIRLKNGKYYHSFNILFIAWHESIFFVVAAIATVVSVSMLFTTIKPQVCTDIGSLDHNRKTYKVEEENSRICK